MFPPLHMLDTKTDLNSIHSSFSFHPTMSSLFGMQLQMKVNNYESEKKKKESHWIIMYQIHLDCQQQWSC